MRLLEGREALVQKLEVWLGVLDFVELNHALLVLDASSLQFGYFLAFQLVDLSAQDDIRIFDDGFDEAEHVERVGRAVLGQALHRIDHVQAQRLQQREVLLQLGVQANAAAFRGGTKLDHACLPQRAQQLERILLVHALAGRRLQAVSDQGLHR